MPDRSWGQHCSGTIKTVVLSNGVKLPVRQEIAELIGLLCEETMRRGYILKPGWCWGYACRKIRGSNSWSNHAWGLAVDLNAPTNPMQSTLKTDMPAWMPKMWKSYGFRWGGDYSGRKDAMHYEFMGSVSDAKRHTDIARLELGKQPQEDDEVPNKFIQAQDGKSPDYVYVTDGVEATPIHTPGEMHELLDQGFVKELKVHKVSRALIERLAK